MSLYQYWSVRWTLCKQCRHSGVLEALCAMHLLLHEYHIVSVDRVEDEWVTRSLMTNTLKQDVTETKRGINRTVFFITPCNVRDVLVLTLFAARSVRVQ